MSNFILGGTDVIIVRREYTIVDVLINIICWAVVVKLLIFAVDFITKTFNIMW